MTPIPERAKRYDHLARLYSDERFMDGRADPQVRAFIAAAYWTVWEVSEPKWSDVWKRMGHPASWWLILMADLPRYAPPTAAGCEHVLTRGPRAGEPCGARPHLLVTVGDPAEGLWRRAGWCSKHVVHGQEVEWAERRRDRSSDPVPHPNVGGVLPSYLRPPRQATWLDEYQSARPSFVAPKVGVNADQWPVMRRVHGPAERPRPKLRLILGGDAS